MHTSPCYAHIPYTLLLPPLVPHTWTQAKTSSSEEDIRRSHVIIPDTDSESSGDSMEDANNGTDV